MKNSKNVGNPNASSSYSYGNINDSAKNVNYRLYHLSLLIRKHI